MDTLVSIFHDGAGAPKRVVCDIVTEVYDRQFDCTKYTNGGVVFIFYYFIVIFCLILIFFSFAAEKDDEVETNHTTQSANQQ